MADMIIASRKPICLISALIIAFFISGCHSIIQKDRRSKEPTAADLGTTIGVLADVVIREPISVEGYGLVGGLNGTGSGECPPRIREYLKRYILMQLPERIDIDKFINSSDTAVVKVEGLIPAAASKNQSFDVKVTALPGTQTTSLENGWLYKAELKVKGTFGISTKVLAKAEGPLFIDKIDSSNVDAKLAYVLAGGRIVEEEKINIVFHKSNFVLASRVRNRLEERFGYETAKAISSRRIELKVPAKYREQKQRFASIVKALYLDHTPEIVKERIKTLVRKLDVSKERNDSEIALEAIGNESVNDLQVLLDSSEEQVRLRAARCMLNLGSVQSIPTLREIAMDKKSAYRLEALQAICIAARDPTLREPSRNDAAAISRRLLRDDDFDIKLAAYEQLRKLDDIAVMQRWVAQSFYLDQIAQTERKVVFVYRSGQSRIVLFGAPIYCHDNLFVQSADGNITINAPPGAEYISIMRRHPRRPEVILQLKSSFELADIIQTLCEEPMKKDKQARQGLGVSYNDVIALLKQMCDKGAIPAEFRAGPLSKIG